LDSEGCWEVNGYWDGKGRWDGKGATVTGTVSTEIHTQNRRGKDETEASLSRNQRGWLN
jgi:hypothetical protein